MPLRATARSIHFLMTRRKGQDKIRGPATGEKPSAVISASAPGATRPGRLQMADIARLAGTARSTVSRALNNSPLISEATRTRIIELARSLNYSVNVSAQNLRRRENRSIALVIPSDVAARQPISDPFFLSLVGSVADAVTESGMDMLLSRVDSQHLDAVADLYESGRAMGIVMVGQWLHHDQLNELALRDVPFVVWGARLSSALYPTVGSDNLKGGALATQHLIDGGRQRILFLGNRELPEVAQRHEGYVATLRAASLPAEPDLELPCAFQAEAARAALLALLERGVAFDGLFAASDVLAMTAIYTLAEHGIRVPADVRVVGFDDIPAAAYFHPPLSTVHQSVVEGGRALVETLRERIQSRSVEPRVLPTRLIVRETSGPGAKLPARRRQTAPARATSRS